MAILPRRLNRLVALAIVMLGVLAATGHAPLYLTVAALPALALALSALGLAQSGRQACLIGWLAGFGYVAGTHFWIIQPFFVDAPRHGWMAPFALFFMASGIALLWAAAYGAAFTVGRGPRVRLLALIVTMTAMEWLRMHLFTGFPWAAASALWMPTPVIQLLALLGPLGVGLFTYGLLILPSIAARLPLRFGVILCAVGGALVLGAGYWGQQRMAQHLPDQDVVLRVVQPNAAQHEKWQREMVPVFFERQLALSAQPLAAGFETDNGRPDVVIWPETAIAYGLENTYGALTAIAEAAQTQVIFGVQRHARPRFYNSMAMIGPDADVQAIYDKHHLVPFGEYMPFGDLLDRIGVRGLAAADGGGYSAGIGPRVMDLGDLGKIVPLICYEAIFPRDVGAVSERADWILHITNDAWFGISSMPYQHLDQSRMRAIEQGLPLVRSANTGISGVIDPYGRIIDSLALGVAGKLDAQLPGALAPTHYARSGDWPSILLLLLLAGALTYGRLRKLH